MNIKKSKLTKSFVLESVKQAKELVNTGKLSSEDLKTLILISPDPKYVGWLAKVWINEKPNIDDLRNSVEEYDTFAKKGKAKTKDIFQFKTFKDLQAEVDYINKSGEGISVKDLESDYETIVDNSDLLIMVPHTHEASRKLGLSYFAFRDCGDGKKDSSWCTTYATPEHFNDYYYSRNVTFYYIKVRSEKMIEELKKEFNYTRSTQHLENYPQWKALIVSALAVLNDGRMEMYDGADGQMEEKDIKKFTSIIGIG